MNRLWRLFKNRDFILALGLALGLLAGQGAVWTQGLTLPALGLVMTLSTLAIASDHFRSPRTVAKAAAYGLILNYLLLAGLILLLGRFFTHDPDLHNGFIILAAVPPAVAIIPFTDFLGGDRPFSLLATMGAYLGALIIMPVLGLAFWGADVVSPWQLVKILLLLIVLPVTASRLLRASGLDRRLEPVKGALTNWSFFLVVYSIVGLNSRFILEQPLALLPVAAVAAGTTFGLGLVLEMGGRLLGVAQPRRSSIVLLGTLKNYGLAGGLALALFSQRTALPAVVATTFMVIYIIWLGLLKRWLRPR